MRLDKSDADPCPDPECFYCALHCPYCGTPDVVLDVEDHHGSITCPTCEQTEDLPHPRFIEVRHEQVQAFTGRSMREWKRTAQQLSVPLRYRWRSTLCVLAPAASAAISRCDDLEFCGWNHEAAMAQAQADMAELDALTRANPALGGQGQGPAFLDDWF